MSRRKLVDNPFAKSMSEFSSKSDNTTAKTVITETRSPQPGFVLQISGGLVSELESVTEDLISNLPSELQTDFTIETLNELIVAYVLSDHRAHDVESIITRLSGGWAHILKEGKKL